MIVAGFAEDWFYRLHPHLRIERMGQIKGGVEEPFFSLTDIIVTPTWNFGSSCVLNRWMGLCIPIRKKFHDSDSLPLIN